MSRPHAPLPSHTGRLERRSSSSGGTEPAHVLATDRVHPAAARPPPRLCLLEFVNEARHAWDTLRRRSGTQDGGGRQLVEDAVTQEDAAVSASTCGARACRRHLLCGARVAAAPCRVGGLMCEVTADGRFFHTFLTLMSSSCCVSVPPSSRLEP